MKLVELILFISIICIGFLNLTKSLNPNMIDLMSLLSSLFFMIQAKQASNKKNKKIYIITSLIGIIYILISIANYYIDTLKL